MLQANELVNLALIAVLSPLIYLTSRGVKTPQRPLFLGAFVAMALAFVATVVEGLFLEELFNLLEHAAFAVAGIVFAVASVRMLREAERDGTSS